MREETMTFEDQIQNSVIQNMSDGVIITGPSGKILYCNPMAAAILETTEEKLKASSFTEGIISHPENDGLAQAVLDAVYSKKSAQTTFALYNTGNTTKQLRLTTSYLRSREGKLSGVIILISDLSELIELRDSLKAMNQIKQLNQQLNDRNELLSKTFGSFLSDEIVSELLDKPGGLTPGGHKQCVTVMMSDLRGFTAMSEQMDPEDLISMLNHYLEAMTEPIQRHGGTIIEFIGDGILAVFGAPKYSDTHASDAVAAALEMQSVMSGVNEWNAGHQFPLLKMGIGIDSGEVIVGNIGSEKRMKYGVVGSHVNMCGRIESYTTGGQILISSEVRSLVESPLEIKKEMRVLPKGADEEVTLSHVVGIGEPYNIRLSLKNDTPIPLPEPEPVSFNRMEEKHVSEKNYYGGVLSVGLSVAELETETDLKLLENIRINRNGHLLCKVIEKNDNVYLLQYTAVPSEYEAWVREWIRDRGGRRREKWVEKNI